MAVKGITRRQFVQTAAGTAAGVLTLGALVAGCDKGDSASGGGKEPSSGESAGLDCTDVSALSDAEKKTRSSFKYVEKSPEPAKLCSNCQLYQAPADGEGCGGCTIVKGPINPNGYCTSWVQATG